MQKLRELHAALKVGLMVGLFVISYVAFPISDVIGHIALFSGLFVIFEGFNFTLFLKIMVALFWEYSCPLQAI